MYIPGGHVDGHVCTNLSQFQSWSASIIERLVGHFYFATCTCVCMRALNDIDVHVQYILHGVVGHFCEKTCRVCEMLYVLLIMPPSKVCPRQAIVPPRQTLQRQEQDRKFRVPLHYVLH